MRKYALFGVAALAAMLFVSGCVCFDLNAIVPPKPNESTGGGTGTQGNGTQVVCVPAWDKSEWENCTSEGKRYRDVWDKNRCGVDTNKPAESEACTYVPPVTVTYLWDTCKTKLTQAEKDTCIYNIALETKRDELPNRCVKDAQENYAQGCVNYFYMCTEIVDNEKRSSCVTILAQKLQDATLCSIFSDEQTRQVCTVKSNPSGFGQ